MPPHKCAYFRCTNTSDHKSMFRFPWRDANRLEVWLNNCGNLALTHLPAKNLRCRYLCQDHFDPKYLRSEGLSRKRLRRMAVPRHFQHCSRSVSPESPESPEALKVLTPTKCYQKCTKRSLIDDAGNSKENMQKKPKLDLKLNVNVNSNVNTLPWNTPKRKSSKKYSPKCKSFIKKIVDLTKKLKREKLKNKLLKDQIKNKQLIDLSKHKFNSESSKLLTLMQLRKSKSKKSWSDEEKKFCMSLYYKSPGLYKHMVDSGIILAAPSTIQRWLQETNCLPGLNDDILINVQNKFANKSFRTRACSVCFDEMSIMVDLEYTNKYDLIEGFEDFGGGDRNQKEAKYALVFIARGIYSNWKIPLAYFLSSRNVDSEKLGTIVKNVINKLFDCGLLPKVIVCDQATTNVKMIKKLGVTVDSPFFFINGRKIYSIIDAPHLIKNIRNNLINSNFEVDGRQISFKDIVNVYDIDKLNKSKSLRKLTPVHINPNNFQKMKVKLATQILSNSVSAAIKTAVESGELKSETAENTADFVKLCNDVFDCLNSKNKFDSNPYRCAITKNQNSIVNQTLIKGKKKFGKLSKISFNRYNQKQLTRPPCFDGMIQTINSIQQLSAEEFTDGTGVKFINTYRLNQDVIENLFGIYRIKGGCNKNPSSKTLRSVFRSNLLNNLIKFDKTNCERDQESFILTQENTQNSEPQTSTSSSEIKQNVPDDEVGGVDIEALHTISRVTSASEEISNTSECEVTLETCSVVYFAGWLAKSCVEKFNCSDCRNILLKSEVDLTDKNQLLLINKTYSNIATPTLKSPSDYLNQLVNKLLDFYNKNINRLHKSNLIHDLMQNFKKEINFLSDYHDLNHFDYLIKKLLEVKIHDYCKSRKKSLQSASKLRILQNK